MKIWDSLKDHALAGNKCCGRYMKKVAPRVRWCTNCGDIVSKWTFTGKPFFRAPKLLVCATCEHWGPESRRPALLCHLAKKKDGEEVYTTAAMTCAMHSPVNKPPEEELTPGKARDMVARGYEPYRFDRDAERLLDAEKLAEEYEGLLEPSDLDELVHELAAAQAAGVNNAGLAEQIVFLFQHLGSQEAVVEKLRKLCKSLLQSSGIS